MIRARNTDEQALERAQENVERIKQFASEKNVPCETVVVQSVNPYKEIIDAAKKHH